MNIFTYRSPWPHYWSDPGTPRKRWDYQKHFRPPYPWAELTQEPDDDVRKDREERERRSKDYGGTSFGHYRDYEPRPVGLVYTPAANGRSATVRPASR